jgi:ribosomal protein S18 acetylase RimI-like enzyme
VESRKSEKKDNIVIRLVKDWPAQEIIGLYEAGEWWDGSLPSSVNDIISGSFVFAVAVDAGSGKAIGMGRVLSDGVSDAYIQDVIVLPEYRRQNIGKKLILALMDHCLKKNIIWISLVAESGTERFYSGLGFQVMQGHTPMRHTGGLK